MDPSFRSGSRSPCSVPHHHQHHHHHHHHRHHHHHPLCYHHHHQGYQLCCQHRHHHHFNFYSHVCPRLASQPPQNPEPILSHPLQKGCSLHTNAYKETSASMTQALQEPECKVLANDVEEEEEEDGDVVFVLTDEWREFFAKSEAKRRLEKQQAKKKEKQ